MLSYGRHCPAVMKVITNNPEFYEVLRKYSESEVKGNSYIMKEVSESKIHSSAGNISGSGAAEFSASYMQGIINEMEE